MVDIACPYCGAEDDNCVSDLWEYEGDENDAECYSCGKEIIINASVSVTYTAKRVKCHDDNHEYDQWYRVDIGQDTLDRWKLDPILSRYVTETEPYSYYIRPCKNCDDVDFSNNIEFKKHLEQHEIKSKFEVEI